MKRNLSITTAAAALLIGTVFAAAQGVQGQGGAQGQGGSQGQGGTQMAPQQDGGKGKAQSKEPRTQGQGGQAQGQGQQGQAAPEGKGKAQSKEPRTKEPRTQGQGQGGQGQRETQGQREGQPQQGQQPKQQPQRGQQGQQNQRDNQKGAESKGGGAQSGANVKLTQEQRTTIRTTVLKGSNAPRVKNVNFSLNVGTVVPRTGVRLVAVPSTLVEIHPAWRGYMYFIVGERIVIVEPDSHKIVAVLVV
jgi:hypothetical protein